MPSHDGAKRLIVAAATVIGRPALDKAWPWPEPRLSYANAALPDALLAAGVALDAPGLVADGLGLLSWLLDTQTLDGHLSVVPVGGRWPGESGPGFDQQPIEVAALAEACARAHLIARRQRWADRDRARSSVVRRRQRRGHVLARTGGRRLRRARTRRPQREPGRGVHVGAAVDAAAGQIHGSLRFMTHAKPDDGVLRTDVVLRADPTRVLARLFVPGQELVAGRPVAGVRRRGSDPGAAGGRGRRDAERRARPLRGPPPRPGGRAAGQLRAGRRTVCRQDVDPSPERRGPHRSLLHATSTPSRRPPCSTPRSSPTPTSPALRRVRSGS